eukprot:TRINITY_DN1351_c0_g1_i14.p1 TRINITY_DN1351_c0_g1~~TRINITY_DN1351_c0_g1_i14.p1  ORF type:complete len:107 (-),score=23.71 TRINITY_DN1351_c0_g1_i14:190-510(-)
MGINFFVLTQTMGFAADYCMVLSVLGFLFLAFLGILVAQNSETLPVKPKNRTSSLVALFVSAFLYAVCFGITYYFKRNAGNARPEELNTWLERNKERRGRDAVELR